MKRAIACLTTSLTLGLTSSVLAQPPASPVRGSPAETAYHDLIARFWSGDAASGHLERYAVPPRQPGEPAQPGVLKGTLWEYAIGVNAIYARWKTTNDPDAQLRLRAMWRWTQSTWSAADVSACGVGTTSTAQDDATWGAGMMVQLFEASGDPKALAYAKAMLDCAWSRWGDGATGGGLWYSDDRREKSSYQGPYAEISLHYFQLSHDRAYLARAQSIDAWAARVLARPMDHLYWEGVAPNGAPLGLNQPNHITKAGSVTFLAGNMAFAALDARLYELTKDPAYRTRAIDTAASIAAKEVASDGAMLDDRDAYTNGWAAYAFLRDVGPLTPVLSRAYRLTAASVIAKDRAADGTYGGDWDGAPQAWSGKAPSYALKVTASAAIWAIATP
jgi:hypothetical protein